MSSEESSFKDIEVVVDNEKQNWLKRTHVGKFLGLTKILMSVKGLDKLEIRVRNDIKTAPYTACWPGSKNQQNKTDTFLPKKSLQYAISRSRKSTYNLRILVKALRINIHENKIYVSCSLKSKKRY